MNLLSIASLVLLAVPASALLRSGPRHRLTRKRNADNDGHRRLAMDVCPGGRDAAPAFLKDFKELNNKQKLALINLGYSSEMWDDDKDPKKYDGVKWEELPSDDQSNFIVLGVDKEVFNDFYDSLFWGKLSNVDPALISAAVTLGYTKEIWNTCYHSVCTAVARVSWVNLTPEQRSAAELFGHTCHSWEYYYGPDNIDPDECVQPYYIREWKGLPAHMKKAAKLLGYNETSWDGKTADPLEYTEWDELTPDQLANLRELGYTEAIYNQFFFYDWDSLPSTVQAAAQTLHLNQESWDGCYAFKLSGCNQLAWGDLTLKQKKAAGEIGVSCYNYDE